LSDLFKKHFLLEHRLPTGNQQNKNDLKAGWHCFK